LNKILKLKLHIVHTILNKTQEITTQQYLLKSWASSWLLFNANSAICQLYHGENKLIFNIVLDQHAELDFYSALALKQQSSDRHVATLGHIILIPSQPVFTLAP
jgi:hypothetical protein